MNIHHHPVTNTYIHALAVLLAEESDAEDEPEDNLDWTPAEEESWAQQDKIDLYRAEY